MNISSLRCSTVIYLLLCFLYYTIIIGAIGYFETSALTCHGLSEAMTAAIRAVFAARRSGPSQKKFNWPWKRFGNS
jgi:hypothetical protein